MKIADFFEIVGEHAVFHPIGHVSLNQAVELITAAITLARNKDILKLLLDTTDLTGFQAPTLGERYFFVKQWARAAGGVRIAVVAKPEMIDPRKFGVIAAHNQGLIGDVFTSKEEALAWLKNSE